MRILTINDHHSLGTSGAVDVRLEREEAVLVFQLILGMSPVEAIEATKVVCSGQNCFYDIAQFRKFLKDRLKPQE